MKKIIIAFFGFLFFASISFAQSQSEPANNGIKNYKITFVDLHESQLKELIEPCSEIFGANAGNMGEPNVLYFNSTINITKEQLKALLENKNISHDIELEIVSQ